MTGRIRRKLGFAATLGLVIAALGAGTASADPVGAKGSAPVTLNCGSGPIDVITNGNGHFTPAHDVNSTSVFIPLQFGADTGVFTDPTGTPHPFSDPAGPPKGSADPQGRTIVNCTFHLDATFSDGARLVLDGHVTGFFTS